MRDKHGAKSAQCVRCYCWAHEGYVVQEDYFVHPRTKKYKIVSYMVKN
jgi:O-glycosyl hydrolase